VNGGANRDWNSCIVYCVKSEERETVQRQVLSLFVVCDWIMHAKI
jgi:hypothetical protein